MFIYSGASASECGRREMPVVSQVEKVETQA